MRVRPGPYRVHSREDRHMIEAVIISVSAVAALGAIIAEHKLGAFLERRR
jgi:hypothetical protein